MLTPESRCQDYGRPGCLETVDERYTMSFQDIGEGDIYWCAHCGPIAEETNKMLTEVFKDPRRTAQLGELLDAAEAKCRAHLN